MIYHELIFSNRENFGKCPCSLRNLLAIFCSWKNDFSCSTNISYYYFAGLKGRTMTDILDWVKKQPKILLPEDVNFDISYWGNRLFSGDALRATGPSQRRSASYQILAEASTILQYTFYGNIELKTLQQGGRNPKVTWDQQGRPCLKFFKWQARRVLDDTAWSMAPYQHCTKYAVAWRPWKRQTALQLPNASSKSRMSYQNNAQMGSAALQ